MGEVGLSHKVWACSACCREAKQAGVHDVLFDTNLMQAICAQHIAETWSVEERARCERAASWLVYKGGKLFTHRVDGKR